MNTEITPAARRWIDELTRQLSPKSRFIQALEVYILQGWMEVVNNRISDKLPGETIWSLPDAPYGEWFQDMMSPLVAAKIVVDINSDPS